jgi:hypothetical protein
MTYSFIDRNAKIMQSKQHLVDHRFKDKQSMSKPAWAKQPSARAVGRCIGRGAYLRGACP